MGLEVVEEEGEAFFAGCSASDGQGVAGVGLPFLPFEPCLNL